MTMVSELNSRLVTKEKASNTQIADAEVGSYFLKTEMK